MSVLVCTVIVFDVPLGKSGKLISTVTRNRNFYRVKLTDKFFCHNESGFDSRIIGKPFFHMFGLVCVNGLASLDELFRTLANVVADEKITVIIGIFRCKRKQCVCVFGQFLMHVTERKSDEGGNAVAALFIRQAPPIFPQNVHRQLSRRKTAGIQELKRMKNDIVVGLCDVVLIHVFQKALNLFVSNVCGTNDILFRDRRIKRDLGKDRQIIVFIRTFGIAVFRSGKGRDGGMNGIMGIDEIHHVILPNGIFLGFRRRADREDQSDACRKRRAKRKCTRLLYKMFP